MNERKEKIFKKRMKAFLSSLAKVSLQSTINHKRESKRGRVQVVCVLPIFIDG
jgi:hypothetical protein